MTDKAKKALDAIKDTQSERQAVKFSLTFNGKDAYLLKALVALRADGISSEDMLKAIMRRGMYSTARDYAVKIQSLTK
jgi:hypothetical protein